MRILMIFLLGAGTLAGAATAQNACPDTHYQCGPGVCCPR
jgi:hypothetical protein